MCAKHDAFYHLSSVFFKRSIFSKLRALCRDEARQQASRLNLKINDVSAEYHEHKAKHSGLPERVSKLESETTFLTRELNDRDTRIADMEAEMAAIKAASERKVTLAERKAAELQRQIDEAKEGSERAKRAAEARAADQIARANGAAFVAREDAKADVAKARDAAVAAESRADAAEKGREAAMERSQCLLEGAPPSRTPIASFQSHMFGCW
jgi:predicted  nucleic acid-binding Zn-ribbon protein